CRYRFPHRPSLVAAKPYRDVSPGVGEQQGCLRGLMHVDPDFPVQRTEYIDAIHTERQSRFNIVLHEGRACSRLKSSIEEARMQHIAAPFSFADVRQTEFSQNLADAEPKAFET